jgi:GNAT superfamily N-acetyltransferase
MKIRQANIEKFKIIWEYSNSPTYNYFLRNLKNNNVEFWTIEESKGLIGELYIFWNSEDKDEANGINRAYLCAFRIQKEYQGQGYGKLLMNTVLERIKDKGFKEVTIGIDNSEFDKLNKMYSKFGFKELIKETNIDYHFINANNKPTLFKEPYSLKLKVLQ